MINFSLGLVQRIRRQLKQCKDGKLPHLRLREFPISGQDVPRYPCVAELTLDELQMLHYLRREFRNELGPEEILHDCDLVRFALQELQLKLRDDGEDVLLRLVFYLWNTRQNVTDASA